MTSLKKKKKTKQNKKKQEKETTPKKQIKIPDAINRIDIFNFL